MKAAKQLIPVLGVKEACNSLALPRATFYRWSHPPPRQRPSRRAPPPMALSKQERQQILGVLHDPEFVDMPPYQIYPTLLDRGIYLCSIRTMYRLLAACGENKERRNQLRHPKYSRPELLATKPNQLWTWDITKLRGPIPYAYYYLYVLLDVFSRYVAGWMLDYHECGQLASQLVEQACINQGIQPNQLTIHADNGAAMTSKTLAQLLTDLGITRSHSRPRCSNDNPFSESHFKTLKYRPEFPGRFGSFEDARSFCQRFFEWYNQTHYHSGIALLHPEDLHYGRAKQIQAQRNQVLQEAYERFPERFKGKQPRPLQVPKAVWINPPTNINDQQPSSQDYRSFVSHFP